MNYHNNHISPTLFRVGQLESIHLSNYKISYPGRNNHLEKRNLFHRMSYSLNSLLNWLSMRSLRNLLKLLICLRSENWIRNLTENLICSKQQINTRHHIRAITGHPALACWGFTGFTRKGLVWFGKVRIGLLLSSHRPLPPYLILLLPSLPPSLFSVPHFNYNQFLSGWAKENFSLYNQQPVYFKQNYNE